MIKTTEELNDARAEQALDRQYNFNGKLMSLRHYLAARTITKKVKVVEYYGKKKVQGAYPCLKEPKITYTLWWQEGERELGIDVPKLVYDRYLVADSTRDSEYERAEWEKEKAAEERRRRDRGFSFSGPFYPNR